ncbi:sugar-transfer associated ATP-grasp domain-containing protein [Ulvibacterium marinum]|uniref:sugar-transfer associated ATP-grasp domain-containing protein n=1 Tax=Ulvibacterium marinum TaxID=2419782 RepID=UPI0024944CCF|nr:sugar-transfer associated ATP-grasp domain-containing protein [Ulvibacterium marinum]
MKKIGTLAKKSIAMLDAMWHHVIHRNLANSALRSVERQKGKTNRKLLKLAGEYAYEVLGSKVYAPWLYVYTAVKGSFEEGWIPDNYYRQIIVPKLQGEYGKLSLTKLHSNSYFKTYRFPDLAYFVNGQWLSKDLQVFKIGELENVIFSEGDRVVFKRDQSFQGKGVHLIKKESFTIEEIGQLGNGVVQKYIGQHPFFNDFGTWTTATIRLTTVVSLDSQASCRTAYLRIGRLGETHVQSRSQVKVGIDINSGELAEYGHLSDWRSITGHPDTRIAFTNKTIPHFNEAMTLCKELHAKVPYIGSIGWDVAIDGDGEAHILEWNGYHNDIKYSEATQGPCFADLGWEDLWRT